ncbi:ATP-binding protein [Piscinibacter sp. XHJ-5]|uniref:sensor histidine kinase n=1 Tax=Piscinibacter sp. XHJ-5 TaxID=3037797 RepID=UPI002452C76D|nr:ATP-binding protein [Piscinibacter sp. XHJ-5]
MSAETILIVDDMPANLGVLTSHLERQGYVAVVAQGGEEGIERAEFVRPDLILLDVMMPGVDGFETCRRLKASELTRDIPVIFMTALADTADKLTGFSVGAVDYVTKPLNGAEVLARIDTHLTLYGLRRQLAQQNAQLQREIAIREETQAALVRSNTELEQLAYVASHDMQEPLRMVASYLQLVAQRYKGQLDADADEFIGYAVDGAKRMQALINDLLAYSRVGTKARPFEATDSAKVVDTALANLRIAVAERGAQVTHGPLPTVMGDSTQLLQLFQNLIGNALKFHGAQPVQVRIEAAAEGAHWRFTVRDNGIGIAPEYHERIFVLFQRLHGRDEYPGTGIGLAICKKIVERHGGTISVESQPGEGSTFTFTMPRA